ncbi:cell division protein ZapD [Nitrosococcus wardiae]|uniref:Cell division protein ZapD n=1 Tax=Nitrosococcus wardiae TaxID=1814290 RepID=A0A4P7BX83_9GAMM|nr:cell division protein ZapD [Nitrosococcus wardiae]QBQ53907.1 cell division protein ZapD [Nitrosococcus wardiae]
MLNKNFYEQPLNERVRTLLRLEFLFRQVQHYLPGESEWDSQGALTGLFELLTIFGRSDLKTEAIKELERLQTNLSRLQKSPHVDRERLDEFLQQIESLADTLRANNMQLGQQLKDSEFLHSIRQRSTIPGGACDFDLPNYHYWRRSPAEQRVSDLENWFQDFDPIRNATELILQLIRSSAPPTPQVAKGGFYQQNLDTHTPYQMVRVLLPPDSDCFPEISGGKHRFSIRFMVFSIDKPTQPVEEDISFELCCCAI